MLKNKKYSQASGPGSSAVANPRSDSWITGHFPLILFCGICFFLIVIFMLKEHHNHRLEDRSFRKQTLAMTAQTVVFQIEEYVKEKCTRLDTLTRNSGIGDIAGELTKVKEGILPSQRIQQINNIVSLSGFTRAVFLNRSGKLLFQDDHLQKNGVLSDDYISSEIVKRGIIKKIHQTGGIYWLVFPVESSIQAFLVQGLRDKNRTITGFAAVGLDLSPIRHIIEQNALIATEFILLLTDRDRTPVFENNYGFPIRQLPDYDRALQVHKKRAMEENQFDDIVTYPVSVIGFDPPGWFISAVNTKNSYNRKIMNEHLRSLSVVTSFFIIFFIFFLIVTHHTSKKISESRTFVWKAARGRIKEINSQDPKDIVLKDFGTRLDSINSFLSRISEGDFSIPLQIRGEDDELGFSAEGALKYFKDIYADLETLSKGEYISDLTEKNRKSNDLYTLLSNLNEKFRKMTEDSYRQITQAHVQMELIRQLSENKSLKLTVDQMLSFICDYAGAQTGVFYVLDESEELFHLKGTYGCLSSDFPEKIRYSEGIAGQAATEKKPLTLKGPGISGPLVKTGLVEVRTATITAYPFLFGEKVIAVMEIGAAGNFKRNVTEIIGNNSKSIAVGIQSALSRSFTEKLLEKTIEQAKIFQNQQEELRVVNQELENQTSALKESQVRLLAREEELNRANVALMAHSRNLEETKSVLEAKAEELVKSNLYKTEFLANMSHELRTPLNSIILLSGLLADKTSTGISDTGDVEKITTFSRVIHNSGRELLNLIDEVLDLTRISTGDITTSLSVYRIKETGRVMKKFYEKTAMEKNIDFTVHLADDLPETILTDPLRLEKILKIFLSNAFKYTGKGSVSLRICRKNPEDIFINDGIKREQMIEFSVSDTGEGIPEDMKEVVFEAFKQVDGSIARRHGGVGLGLTLAREFSRLLSGEIVLESELGKGSIFYLYIPEKIQV